MAGETEGPEGPLKFEAFLNTDTRFMTPLAVLDLVVDMGVITSTLSVDGGGPTLKFDAGFFKYVPPKETLVVPREMVADESSLLIVRKILVEPNCKELNSGC